MLPGTGPVGYLSAEWQADRSLYLDFLGVHPAHRRRGIATQLLGAAVAEARSRGMSRVDLTVRRDNIAAVAAYRAAGFRTGRALVPYRRGFRMH